MLTTILTVAQRALSQSTRATRMRERPTVTSTFAPVNQYSEVSNYESLR